MRTFGAFKAATLIILILSLAMPLLAQDDKPLSKRDARRYIEAAEKALKDDKPAEAGGLFLRVLQDFPDDGDSRIRLARIYRGLEEWGNAASAYALAVEHLDDAKDQAECYEGMTIGYSRSADYVKAVEVGRKAMEMNPESADVAIGLAMGLAKTGQLDEAAQIAEQALVLAPDNAFAHNTLGEAALANGDRDKAKVSFQKALELDPNTAEAHAGLAEVLFAEEDYAGAADSASAALGLNDQLTRAYGIRGKANNALGNSTEAYSDLAMAITVNADDPDANLAFAQVYHSQNNLGMATTYYEKTIALNPNLTVAYDALGEIYVGQRKFGQLGQVMQQLVAADPDYAKGHLYLGISYEDAKNSEGALAEFTKAAELDDSLAEAYYRKGRLLRTQKQVAESLVALQKAESLDSGNADYLTELGIAHYESQQLQPALEALEKAVTSPEYANALGWAYYGVTLKDSQRFAEAVDNFQKAVAAFPNYGLAHWGLAWSAFGQITAGCPCTPEDDALVALIVDHSAKAVEYGVNDPGLQERSDILGRGEKIK